MISPRKFPISFASVVFGMHVAASHAAQVEGVVVADDTGNPIEAAVNAYMYGGLGGDKWVAVASSRSSPVSGKFAFPYLRAGTYYFFTQPLVQTNYVGEYYDDTHDWNAKEEMVLAESDNKDLGTIGLSLKPFYLQDLTTDVDLLPVTGGKIRISGKAINTTGGPLNAVVWVNLVTPNYDTLGLGYYTPGTVTSVKPKSVKLPASSYDFKLSAVIPNYAPNDRVYYFDVSVGLNPADPIATERVGPVWKGDARATAGAQSPEISDYNIQPKQLSADGAVLEWQIVQPGQ